MPFELALGARNRKSPFFEATVAAGVTQFTVYNHMYMPTSYGDPAAEYRRLTEGVAMWDVSVERQVQLAGPDALALARILTPRNLDKLKPGQGRYVPICDHRGAILNDPVLLPLADDLVWLSIADSDMVLWARAIAAERGLDVTVSEPDVSPLAIQGPKAEEVVAGLFGEWVRELSYFGFRETELDGIALVVARSGWSKQGGFELYLRDGRCGTDLWNRVVEAGRGHDIGPGSPNPIERMESGLISIGADTDDETNPFELGLGRFVDVEQETDFIGKAALARIADEGRRRQFVGYRIDGPPLAAPAQHRWPLHAGGKPAGFVSSAGFSPRVDGGSNIGVGLVETGLAEEGTELACDSETGPRTAKVAYLPFATGGS